MPKDTLAKKTEIKHPGQDNRTLNRRAIRKNCGRGDPRQKKTKRNLMKKL